MANRRSRGSHETKTQAELEEYDRSVLLRSSPGIETTGRVQYGDAAPTNEPQRAARGGGDTEAAFRLPPARTAGDIFRDWFPQIVIGVAVILIAALITGGIVVVFDFQSRISRLEGQRDGVATPEAAESSAGLGARVEAVERFLERIETRLDRHLDAGRDDSTRPAAASPPAAAPSNPPPQ